MNAWDNRCEKILSKFCETGTLLSVKIEPRHSLIVVFEEGVEVFVNEKSIGIQVIPPYRYEISSCLKEGENAVRIEVATTLEQEMADNPGTYLKAEEKTILDPTGITGEVIVSTGE